MIVICLYFSVYIIQTDVLVVFKEGRRLSVIWPMPALFGSLCIRWHRHIFNVWRIIRMLFSSSSPQSFRKGYLVLKTYFSLLPVQLHWTQSFSKLTQCLWGDILLKLMFLGPLITVHLAPYTDFPSQLPKGWCHWEVVVGTLRWHVEMLFVCRSCTAEVKTVTCWRGYPSSALQTWKKSPTVKIRYRLLKNWKCHQKKEFWKLKKRLR